MTMPLTSSEIEHIASETAKAAVRETLLAMGVDVSKPEAIQEMQKDFADLRAWRTAKETIKRQSLITAVGILISGTAGALYMAFRGGH